MMQINLQNHDGIRQSSRNISRTILSPQNQIPTDRGLTFNYNQKEESPQKKKVTISSDLSIENCMQNSSTKKEDKLDSDREGTRVQFSIQNQQIGNLDSPQLITEQQITYPTRATDVNQNTENNPTLADNQNDANQRLDIEANQNGSQCQGMSEEDKVKSQMIIKSVIIKSMNVYIFLIIVSAQMMIGFNYKAVVSILLLFDFFSLYTNFQKYRLNKNIDLDEFQTDEEIEFRSEYNKYLLLKVIELVVFFIFKILYIIRQDVVHINLIILTSIVFFFVVFKIIYTFKIKVKEYNPIFNETLLWLFKLFISFQALLISLRIEQAVEWDWFHMFWPAYVFLFFIVFITIGLIFVMLSKCYFSIKRNSQKKPEIIGIGWLLTFMIGFTVTSVLFVRSFILSEQNGDEDSIPQVLFVSLVFLVIMFLYTLLEWNQINKFVYEISIIVNAEEEEDIEYVMDENPLQQKKAKNKQKRIKTINPTEQGEENNIPQFLQKLSSTYFSAISNKGNQNNLQPPKRDVKKNKAFQEQKKGGQRQKSQSFMIHKFELKDHSLDFNKNEGDDNTPSAQKNQQIQQGQQQSRWKKLAQDTNQKFKKLIDTPQIQKLSQQINTHFKKRLFMSPHESPKNKVSKSNNVSFVGHKEVLSQTTNKKIEESIIEDNEIQVNAPNMNDQTNTTCVICFDNTPDSVYMPCGHGGVCYECSVDIMKNTGECYLCREAIKEILRLDIKDKGQNGNFRVLALTTMVDESVIDDKQKHKNELNNINEVEEDHPE